MTHPIVLMFVSEGTGISSAAMHCIELSRFDIKSVTIPMTRKVESFNVAVAGSNILSEMQKQRSSMGGVIR